MKLGLIYQSWNLGHISDDLEGGDFSLILPYSRVSEMYIIDISSPAMHVLKLIEPFLRTNSY